MSEKTEKDLPEPPEEKKQEPKTSDMMGTESISDVPAVATSALSFDWGGLVLSIFTNGLVAKTVSLVVLILGEVFEAKKRAREKDEKFILDQKLFNEIVAASLDRMLTSAKQESGEARDVEDQMDKDRERGSLQ